MKSKSDPRHLRRIKNMQALFAWDCARHHPQSKDSTDIIKHIPKIDQLIITHAPKWPIDQINKIDLAILRCALWELKHRPQTPPKVVIDEAVEIAKEFGTEKSFSFVNGVIGGIINCKTNEQNPA